jgi:iron complex outermembrane receptor protein
MHNQLKSKVFCSTGLGALCFSMASFSGAYAQATAAPDQVQEVVVTAQKRSENIQNVPIQITAYSGAQLASANVKTTQDVLNLTPNVSLDHSFTFLNSFVVIRGVAEINNADSPLSIVVDGVPQNNQKQALMDLFDVQQIEILRGPQGSLYGRNAIGGAMIITSQPPTNNFRGYGQVDYGNGNAVNAIAAVSGPLIKDTLLFRVSADVKSSDGLIENAYLHANVDKVDYDDTIRSQLLYTPTSNLSVDWRGSYNEFKGGATYDSVVFSGNANDIEPPTSDSLGKSYGYVGDTNLKVDDKLPFATLTSITAYTKLKEDYRGSLDFTNPVNNPEGLFGLYGPVSQGQNLNDENFSQEFRLTSPSNQAFRWVAGVYGIVEDRELLTRAWVNSPLSEFGTPAFYNPPSAVLQSFAGFNIPSQVIVDHQETDHNDAYAVYGQVDYDLTQQLTLTGGFRYDSTTRHQNDDIGGGRQSATFSSPQPKVTVTYKVTPTVLTYATYSTGFRSGGFNAPGISIPEFKAETLTNYEIGFKSSFFDKRLTFNGDYYFTVDHNFQFFYVQASTGSQVISNIDAVHISGVELEAQAHPFAGLNLSAGLGTTDTDIERSSIYPGYVGNKTPKTIPYKVNLAAQYNRQIVEGWDGMVRIDYEHKDKEYWQVDNADVQRSLDLVNGRIGVSHGNYGFYIWGRNLTNERYYEDYNPSKWSGLPYDIGSLADPRTYGLEATARF